MPVDPDLLRRAITLSNAGQRAEALRLFLEIVERDPQVVDAWIHLADLVDDPEDQIIALENALTLRPGDPVLLARHGAMIDRRTAAPLLPAQPASQPLSGAEMLKQAKHLEENGGFEQAAALYQSVEVHSRLPAERLEARRRMENLWLRQDAHNTQPVNATLDLVRMAAGPTALFLLMLFMQGGLNVTHVPLLAVPGLFSVASGGLLVAVTEMRPAPPLWIALFGKPGDGDEPEMRRWMRLLGWAMLLAPFTIFLMEAGYRLGVLQSSMLGGLP